MMKTCLQDRKKIWFSALFIALSFYLVNGQQAGIRESDLSQQGYQAYRKLLTASGFYIGPVGVAGKTTREECEFRLLAWEENSATAFQSLIDNANHEGGLYGLFGLWLKDKKLFEKAFDSFKTKAEPPERKWLSSPSDTYIPKGSVMVNGGGFYEGEKVLIVIEKIKAGKYNRRWEPISCF